MNRLSFRLRRRTPGHEILSVLLCACLVAQSVPAAAPTWWSRQQVLAPDAPADDFAAANAGQLKYFAAKAAAEMDANFPGGAGEAVHALLSAWAGTQAGGATRDDYAVVNVGQLKAAAKPFYDRIIAAGVRSPGSYPWTGNNADDYALANLGQLKSVFAFDLPSLNPASDTNHNGIPDAWETQMFGDLDHSPDGDEDGDGVSNLDEWLQGTNPNHKDARALHLEVYLLATP